MIYLKTPHQINELEKVNRLGAEFLQTCYEYLKVGIVTEELEELAQKFCEKNKVRPSFYKYRGFPHLLCVSINEEVVHGFPSDRVIENGDVVSIDFGLERNGYFSDAAFTKIVGKASKKIEKLVRTTEECLYKGIEQAAPGKRIYDISWEIQSHASKKGFDVIRDYVGHAVGFELHEDPKIPNYVSLGVNWKLRPGMVLAIEPMLVENDYKVNIKSNKWTVVTADSKMATHFEHSVAVLEGGPKILSKL